MKSILDTNAPKSKVPQGFNKWQNENPWLKLNDNYEAVCIICTKAVNEKLILHFTANDIQSKQTWIINGFSNWKHGKDRIKAHSKSSLHMACAESLENVQKINVVQRVSSAVKIQMKENRTALQIVFSTLKVLAQQGMPLRGSNDDKNSNFLNILKLRAEDVKELQSWLNRSGHKWLHHDVQNEVLECMAKKILSNNLKEIKSADFYGIL